jgi:hypothetical protein
LTRGVLHDDFGDFGSEGLHIAEGAACGHASVFHKRRIQNEGAAIDKGMIGDFEGFAFSLRCGPARKNFLIHYQIGLKLKGITRIPALEARQGTEEFLAKRKGVLPFHWFEFGVFRGGTTLAHDVQRSRGTGKQRFPLQQSKQVAVQGRVNLQTVAAMLDDIRIDESRNETLTNKRFAQPLGQMSGDV